MKDKIGQEISIGCVKFHCVRDFVLLRPDYELISKGGIVIPANAMDETNPLTGVVVSVGCGLVEGGRIIPLVVKVGDRVQVPRNSGTIVELGIEKEKFFALRENQVIGVIE